MPCEQKPLAQSVLCKQRFEMRHDEQLWPPQSVSVSSPFLVLSKHVAAAQMPATQT
jgi:hypothetical protein